MAFLSSLPVGFTEAVDDCNALPESLLAEMCQDVMAYLQTEAGFICIDHYDMIVRASCKEKVPSAQNCVNALTFIYRSAAESGISSEVFLSELKRLMQWKQPSLAALYHVWKSGGQELVGKMRDRSLNIGELVGVEWKMGVSMSSNYCKSLGNPHVTLLFRVATPDGLTKNHSVEMSQGQFQNFAQQLREMSAILETSS